jgi:hypothetical protein
MLCEAITLQQADTYGYLHDTQEHQDEISIVINRPTLECRDLGPLRPQHPCSHPWGSRWRRSHQTQGTIPHLLLAFSLPAASRARVLELARLWAVLGGREHFSA